jgi:peptidoglycan glycosyltransferase
VNGAIRKIALGLGLAFLALMVNLNVVQVARSDQYADNTYNRRKDIDTQNVKRGEIIAADGEVVGESELSGDKQFKWKRRYPLGALMGHITGYYTSPFFCGSFGLERTQTDYISGLEPKRSTDFVDELLGRKHNGNSVKLTVYPELQRLAKRKYGKQRGGVAVIDTKTGAVMALYGTPAYDPNDIAGPSLGDCQAAKQKLDADPEHPLLSRAYQQRYPPGSTFKILTAAAGLELGKMTEQTSFRSYTRLDLPDTDKSLGNFGGETCGGSILHSFEVSCNTTFAQVGLRIGQDKLVTMAERFGLDGNLDFDLELLPSCVQAPAAGRECDTPDLARPFVAYSAIGQYSVRVTPLQMAVVGATVENGGYVPRPHVVERVVDENNRLLLHIKPQRSKRIYSAKVAKEMQHLMRSVVCNGTGRVVGFRDACKGVGGKTGTAQTGIPNDPPHVWFVAWEKGIAVAAVVENGGTLRSEATGGRVAGPIAKAMLEAAVRIKQNIVSKK